ncbi:hypothetical protein N0V84_000799 [Fusarium piperis]|uniref:Amino acid transporter transmembrane domain-containing protein n=1 Tax=Fusarium piperis TaxID=1435070 RepID=A0A9W9BUI0_9HYPO|nr:hypothetical protein N0V84_000799 [Fusarium piperis]
MSTSSEKEAKRDFGQDVEFQPTQSHADETIAHDAVFGEITDKGPNYRNVGWIGTVALMMKTQIGLGVLSIPAVFHSLGLVPGMVALIAIAVITTWSGYVVGTFKLRHPEVYGIDDAGALMFGRIGREVFGIAFCLFWIFVAGSGMLGISIALNAVSMHGACTAVFVAVAAIIGFGLASIRTLGRISWLAWVGLICLLTAIFTVTIAVGVQDRPADAPQEGTWKSDYKIVNKGTPFTEAISAVSSLIFAYAGTPAYFAIAAEMRNPQHYTRSLIVCQSGMTITYIIIGCVVYVYCGSYVATPALGSAGAMIKKVAYGLALPGLIASTTLVIHYSAKYAFVRMLRGSKHLTSNSLTHWATWLGCTTTATIIAYLIASGIPVFGGLVSLVGALLGTLMSFQPMGCMWLYDNWGRRREVTLGWYLMVVYSVFVVVSGTFLMIGGTYGSIVGIIDSMKETGGSPAWACADNSNSV